MTTVKKLFAFFILLPCLVFAQVSAQKNTPNNPDALLKSYILLDAATGQILMDKNPDIPLPPASITKLMTAYLVFDALKSGRIHLQDEVKISTNAYQQEGSRMFVELNSVVSVNDLLQGLIVQSGNDAAVALAEYVGGDVTHFVALMNQAAQKLGMSHSHFNNPTGLPNDAHYATARDIATLARAIIQEFPEYYHYYRQKSFRWNKITQPNRNRLLFTNANIDGLKTGHTTAAGYCLVASEVHGNLRLISVVLGAKKETDRFSASQFLLNQGFARFTEITALKANQVLLESTVWKGKSDSVPVVAAHEVKLLIPVNETAAIKADVQLDTLVAPITQGQPIGTIYIRSAGKTYASVPAIAGETIEEAGFFKRQWHALKLWWKN